MKEKYWFLVGHFQICRKPKGLKRNIKTKKPQKTNKKKHTKKEKQSPHNSSPPQTRSASLASSHWHRKETWGSTQLTKDFWNCCSYSDPRFLICTHLHPTQTGAAPDSWAIPTGQSSTGQPPNQTVTSLISQTCLLELMEGWLRGPLLHHPTALGALLCRLNR